MGKRSEDRRGSNRKVLQSLMLITQFGIQMLVPIFLCSFLGMWIDRKAGTSYWMIVLFFMGALAGFTNIYRLAKKVYGADKGTKK